MHERMCHLLSPLPNICADEADVLPGFVVLRSVIY